jgi:GNAT superfamily N-acetyltransferase
MAPRVSVEVHPDAADARVVFDGLLAFNVAVIGPPDLRPVACFLRDDDGRVLGGLLGEVKWRWLFIAKFWLPESLRGQRHGSRLLEAITDWAWAQGCLGINLDTLEYQALPFYEKHGFELFGTLEGFPPGYRQYFLKKTRP